MDDRMKRSVARVRWARLCVAFGVAVAIAAGMTGLDRASASTDKFTDTDRPCPSSPLVCGEKVCKTFQGNPVCEQELTPGATVGEDVIKTGVTYKDVNKSLNGSAKTKKTGTKECWNRYPCQCVRIGIGADDPIKCIKFGVTPLGTATINEVMADGPVEQGAEG